MDYLTDMKIKL